MAAGRLRAWEDVAGRATMGSIVNLEDTVMKQSRVSVSPMRCGFWGEKRERMAPTSTTTKVETESWNRKSRQETDAEVE